MLNDTAFQDVMIQLEQVMKDLLTAPLLVPRSSWMYVLSLGSHSSEETTHQLIEDITKLQQLYDNSRTNLYDMMHQ